MATTLDEALLAQLAPSAERYFGERGLAWLRELSHTLDRFVRRWSLVLGDPFPDLWHNYVAQAIRADGTPCVLKVGVPCEELNAEIESLRHWDGRGIARLLAADPDEGAFLLERVEPGTMLSEMAAEDEEAATLISAHVIGRLWRPPPDQHHLIALTRWFRDLLMHRQKHDGPGRFPSGLFERGESLAKELLGSTQAPVMLHGDLHHFNILSAEREPWLAIDPKGLVGEAGFEIAAFLRNPEPQPPATLTRRLDILTSELGLDRRRTRDWCFAEAMLNACWSHDDSQKKFQSKVAWAELMLTI